MQSGFSLTFASGSRSYVWLHALPGIAVGTALAGGPPDRSQRAGLPHWALTRLLRPVGCLVGAFACLGQLPAWPGLYDMGWASGPGDRKGLTEPFPETSSVISGTSRRTRSVASCRGAAPG